MKGRQGTIRATFVATGGEVALQSVEWVDILCPPAVGDRPKEGVHGGYWMEVRDANGEYLFHRGLHFPLGDSVEVHSEDGTIERFFGPPMDNLFVVLVPDDVDARQLVLMGTREPLAGPAHELARFDIPKADGGAGGAQ